MSLSISLDRRTIIVSFSRYSSRADSNKSCSRDQGHRTSCSPTNILTTWFVLEEMLISLGPNAEGHHCWCLHRSFQWRVQRTREIRGTWANLITVKAREPQRGDDAALSLEKAAQVHKRRWRQEQPSRCISQAGWSWEDKTEALSLPRLESLEVFFSNHFSHSEKANVWVWHCLQKWFSHGNILLIITFIRQKKDRKRTRFIM